jgi:nitrate reductase NapE component
MNDEEKLAQDRGVAHLALLHRRHGPILAVLIVSGYGFAVWMWQTFVAGPPTY